MVQIIRKIDENKIFFLNPVKQGEDIVINIQYTNSSGDKIPLLYQTPALYLNDTYNTDKRQIILPLQSKNSSKTNDIHSSLRGIDLKILELLKNINTSNKFKVNNFKSIINEVSGTSSNIYKNGVIRLLINNNTKLYNRRKEFIEQNNYNQELVSGVFVKCIIEINSIVIRNSEAHVYIINHQMRVVHDNIVKKVVLTDYSFLEDTELEQEDSPKELLDYTEYMDNDTDSDSNKMSPTSVSSNIEEDTLNIQDYEQAINQKKESSNTSDDILTELAKMNSESDS